MIEFGEGNWEIENYRDLGDEVEIKGMENYSQNKGFQICILDKNQTNIESKLDEVSLKRIQIYSYHNPQLDSVGTWAIK